jgi:hypothetical protein
MTGKQQPERLGPWYPSDIPESEWEELRPLAEEIEKSGFSLDWYGGQWGQDGSHSYDALVLTVDEKTKLDGETPSSKIARERHNRHRSADEQKAPPDVRQHPMRWPIFIEQAGVRRATRLVDAIAAALEAKREASTDDSLPEVLVSLDS